MSRRSTAGDAINRVPTEPEHPKAKQPVATTRRLFGYLRPFWKQMILATIFLLFSTGAGLIFPWVIQHLLDSVFVHHDRGLLNQIALLLILVFLVRSLFDFGQNYLVSYASERLVANLRKQVYGHLQSLSLTFFNSRRTGEMMSRVTTDVVVAQTGLTNNILTLVQQV
ncbi:MAG TPA: ABC transporter transmembrane domain-containing protein, partial [Ktedonobacteraceae bacterium]|nr:ABC transporter transmembrane domain-containing protein [Ktedonobacteraceae bacterium]